MRRTKKGFFVLLSVIAACIFAFVFAACDDGNDGKKTPCVEHTFGEWVFATAGNCKDPGTEKRTCSKCDYTETRNTVKDPDTHYGWSEWECDIAPDCRNGGHEFRICLGCNAREERDTDPDPDAHLYGTWTLISPSSCSVHGERTRTCSICNEPDTEELPFDTNVHNYKQGTVTPSTCTTKGKNNLVCDDCGHTDTSDLPLDTHNHSSDLVNGICPDCHGMLTDDLLIDNSTGKDLDSFGLYLDGDFNVKFEYDAKAGVEPDWDNFIIDIAPAGYINGELTRSLVGRMLFVPYPRGGDHYLTWRQYYNYSVDTTWFFDENNTDLIYQDCVQKGVKVVTTLIRTGDIVDLRIVMTVEMNGKYYDCVVTTKFNYPAIDVLYVGLTGEDSSLTLKQTTLVSGAIAEPTVTESGVSVLSAPVAISNPTGKNADGLNITVQEGDFDIQYTFDNIGDPNVDWSAWIMHMFKDADDFTVGAGHKLFFTGTANGSYSEMVAETFKTVYNDDHTATVNWQFRADTGNFASNLANSTVTLRIKRKNGVITLFGYAINKGGFLPFAYYTDSLNKTYNGILTIRLTSEKSSLSVTDLTVYAGKATKPDGSCLNHSYGDWSVVKTPTCTEPGEKQQTCSVCNDIRTEAIPATDHDFDEWVVTEPDRCKPGSKRRDCKKCDHYETEVIPATGEHSYGEWETVKEPVCGTPGEKKRTCSVCGDVQTEAIPATGVHSYGEWSITKPATCTEDGEKQRTCEHCNDVETEVIPSPGHSYGEWVTTAATCMAAGSRSKECSACHDIQTETLPVDPYNHAHAFVDGACPDCHGVLTEQKRIDNTSVKLTDLYDLYMFGDFELEYSFKNISGGVDYNWDNFILVVGQAQYAGGKLVHPSVRNSGDGNRGDFETIPYMTNNLAGDHFALFWNKFGNSMTITWFRNDTTGAEVPFADAMKTNPYVVATVKRVGNLVTLTYVMTADLGTDTATCTVVYNIYVAAAHAVYLGLSGEECVLELDQVKLLSGKFAPATKTESGENALDGPQTLNNLGASVKNVQGVNVTLGSGDFDIEYRFESSADGSGRGDWDNWILYMFKDSDDLTVGGGHKVYWSMTANGAEPENYATVYQDVNWSCFNKRNYGDFAAQLIRHCTFHLRIVRKAGYITVIGDGYLDGEDTPFVRWAYNTYKITYDGKLTIRLTSQNSTLTVNDIICYTGTATGTDGLCVVHRFGEWSAVTEATCGAPGMEHHVCPKCNKEETREIPATGLHEYSDDGWETVTEPQCGDAGSERRKCKNCDHYETREIPATGSHTYGEWTTVSAATCIAKGTESHTCSVCNKVETREVGEVDLYAHTHDFVNGVCPDCHGMLTAERVVDNTSGKGVDTYSHYFKGDFKLVYEYYAKAGENGEWHNFIFNIAPGLYVDGNLSQSDMGRIMLLPFPKDKNHYCGGATGYKWWKVHGIQVNTNWFFSADGTDLGFQNCVKAGVDVVTTLERIGDNVNVRIVMTYDNNGEPVDCVVTTVLAYPGIENLFVGLTGESSSLTLKQFRVENGTFSPLTFDKTGTNVIETPVELNNAGTKNVQGLNYSFDGDFDVEYDLTLAGDDVNDWHSWILYMFKDADDFAIDGNNGHKLFYCGTANGEYSEGSVPTYKIPYFANGDRDGNWNFRVDTGDFAANLQNSKAKIRIIRKNGQITVMGYGYKDDGTVIVRYVDPLIVTYDGTLTLRFTSEKSVCTVTGLTVYEGTPNLITTAA